MEQFWNILLNNFFKWILLWQFVIPISYHELKIRLVALLANCTASNETVKKTIWKIREEILNVDINDWLLIILLKTLMNVCLTILGLSLLCDEVVPKNGIKQMINADLGVIQALFDLNTVFTVTQNNSHKDCSIFNLNLLRPCG